jgi:hypothetical protein
MSDLSRRFTQPTYIIHISEITYFPPVPSSDYCCTKNRPVLTTAIHVSPIAEGRMKPETVITAEFSNARTEVQVKADRTLSRPM